MSGNSKRYMNPETREAFELLKLHKWAWLTHHATTIDNRRKKGERLLVNVRTAEALARRGVAVFEDANGDEEADKVRIVDGLA